MNTIADQRRTRRRTKRPPERDTPFDDPNERFAAGRFGMGLLLVTLGMLFAASAVGFIVLRLTPTDTPMPDLPPLPRIMWLGTALLILSSVTMQVALHAARDERPRRLIVAMLVTTTLGLSFLGIQTAAWDAWGVAAHDALGTATQHVFMVVGFFVLTGLHAAHVIGGLIPMVVVTVRSMRRGYSAADHRGVHYCTMYWHFLDVVWLALFALLVIGTP